MKRILLKAFKWLFIAALLFLLVLSVVGLVLILDWPRWMVFVLLLAIFGLVAVFVILKKIWFRRRERRFVQQVIQQDNTYLTSLGSREQERHQELQDRWKDAIDTLRKSHLKQHGNPLYMLPWYIVLGESGSGKTTAIESAKLSSPFAEMSRTQGISGTRNCDWWFLEHAIIIDTAGRYAIPLDEGRDKEEWRKFLTNLSKFRKKEPLNGLIVTLPAEKLLSSNADELEKDGKEIRLRIDELMRGVGAKFPIFVLVTKCDLIQGMAQFCNLLPEKAVDQAMGVINEDLTSTVGAFTEQAFQSVVERLKDFRLILLNKESKRLVDPNFLLFPEEFERMQPSLQAFIKGAFKENPFQETPILRGIFFSSGKQEGSPYSHFLKSQGFIDERETLPGTNKGLFLYDFFSKILPKDRYLFSPIQQALQWSRFVRNLGIAAWLALSLSVCGLLSFSFIMNLRTLREVSKEFTKTPTLLGDVVNDVELMERFHGMINKVQEQNEKWWWIPRLGLNESKEIEERLKKTYAKIIKDGFWVPADHRLAERITGFSENTPDDAIGDHVLHLTRRINLLESRLEGDGIKTMRGLPTPEYGTFISTGRSPAGYEIGERFHQLNLYHLIWRPDREDLNTETVDLRRQLDYLLNTKRKDLRWLVSLINGDPSFQYITLGDFWGGRETGREEEVVEPAFTMEGKEQIDALIGEIEDALVDPLILRENKDAFQRWYRARYLDTWEAFALSFPQGRERLEGKEQWRRVLVHLGRDTGPFFHLMGSMTAELEPFVDSAPDHPWVPSLYAFEEIREIAGSEEQADDPKSKGLLKRMARKAVRKIGGSKVSRMGRYAGKLTPDQQREQEMEAVSAFQEYRQAIEDLSTVEKSTKEAYEKVKAAFTEDKGSIFLNAKDASNRLENAIVGLRKGDEKKVFETIVKGPVNLLWDYSMKETACHLQRLWEDKVYWQIEKIKDPKARLRLLSDDQKGFAVTFAEKEDLGGPFIKRSVQRDFLPRQVMGSRIPFNQDFFNFLAKVNEGRAIILKEKAEQSEPKEASPEKDPVKSSYVVTITGLPTDVNEGVLTRPHAVKLEVHCATKRMTLTNLQYPVREAFDWSPTECGDVVLKIEIGDHVLKQVYRGEKAFPRFLRSFSRGYGTFYPRDFPEKEAILRGLNIEYIRVNYRFIGHGPVIALLSSPAPKKSVPMPVKVPKVPRRITACWE